LNPIHIKTTGEGKYPPGYAVFAERRKKRPRKEKRKKGQLITHGTPVMAG